MIDLVTAVPVSGVEISGLVAGATIDRGVAFGALGAVALAVVFGTGLLVWFSIELLMDESPVLELEVALLASELFPDLSANIAS